MKIEDYEDIGKEGRVVWISERENDESHIDHKNINVPLLTIVAEEDEILFLLNQH
jgi:hypothetical protein